MGKFALNLGTDNRVLSVCECIEGIEYTNVVDSFPDGNVKDYKYINNEYVYNPEPKEPEKPTQLDALEAQVTYTAMMTDTLLETEV